MSIRINRKYCNQSQLLFSQAKKNYSIENLCFRFEMTNKRFQMKQREVFVFIAVLQKICKISHRNYVNEEEATACFKDFKKSLQILN